MLAPRLALDRIGPCVTGPWWLIPLDLWDAGGLQVGAFVSKDVLAVFVGTANPTLQLLRLTGQSSSRTCVSTYVLVEGGLPFQLWGWLLRLWVGSCG